MIFNFSTAELSQKMLEAGVPSGARRSILGMIRKNSILSERDAVLFLERKGLVKIDRNFCCNCGTCSPEPLVSLK